MEKIIDSLSKRSKIEKKKNKAKKIANSIVRFCSILSAAACIGLGGQGLDSYYRDTKQYHIANCLINKNLPASDKAAFDFLKRNPNLIDKFPDNNFRKLKGLKRVVLDNDYSSQDSTVLEKKIGDTKNPSNIINLEEARNNLILMSRFNIIYDGNTETLYKCDIENDNLEGKIEKVKDFVVLPGYVYFIQGKDVFRKSEKGDFERVWKADSDKCRFAKIWGTDFGVIFDDEVKILVGYNSLKNMIEYFEINSLLKKLEKFNAESLNRVVYKNNILYAGSSSIIVAISGDKSYQIKWSEPGSFSDYLVLDIDNNGEDEIVASDNGVLSRDQYRVYNKDSLVYYLRYIDNLEFDYNNPVSEDFKLLINPSKLKKQIKERLAKNE